MKNTAFRIISLIHALVLTLLLFSACKEAEAPPSPTLADAGTENTEPPDAEADSTESSPTESSEAAEYANLFYEFTVPDETAPLRKEAPEIEAKIKGRYNSIRRKVIIEFGGKRDVPYLLILDGKVCNAHVDGYAIACFTDKQLCAVMDELPVYTVKGDETLLLYSNDKLVGAEKLNIRELLPEERQDEYSWGSQYAMEDITLAEAAEKLEKGRHIAWVPVRCEGDRIENMQGAKLGRESLNFYAYLILDIQ